MATKNLGRTVIEAGRTQGSKDARRQTRRLERRDGSKFCREAEGLVGLRCWGDEEDELDNLSSMPPPRPAQWIAQDDKLGPAMRWMASKCGEKWDDVFSELSIKFRSKGIALSHVVDTHMLAWVQDGTQPRQYRYNWYEFIVDQDGILRKNMEVSPWRSRNSTDSYNRWEWVDVRRHRLELAIWAGDKKLIVRGDNIYWAVPTNSDCSRCTVCTDNAKLAPAGISVWPIRWYWLRERGTCREVSYRQDVPFSDGDYTIYDALPPVIKRELLYKEF